MNQRQIAKIKNVRIIKTQDKYNSYAVKYEFYAPTKSGCGITKHIKTFGKFADLHSALICVMQHLPNEY